MKNLSEFKRRLKVGKKMKATRHQFLKIENETLEQKMDLGTRLVSIVQTNSFALQTTLQTGKTVNSWCDYPSAKQVKILDPDTIQFLEIDKDKNLRPVLTYQFID